MATVAGEIVPQSNNTLELLERAYLRLQSSRNLSVDLKKEFDGLRKALGEEEGNSLRQEREVLQKEIGRIEKLGDSVAEIEAYVCTIVGALEMALEVPDIYLRAQMEGSLRNLSSLGTRDDKGNLKLQGTPLGLFSRIRVMSSGLR